MVLRRKQLTGAAAIALGAALILLLTMFAVTYQKRTWVAEGSPRSGGFWRQQKGIVIRGEHQGLPLQLPGPLDVWGGGVAHEITIALPFSGLVDLTLETLESHENFPPVIAVMVDGVERGRIAVSKGEGRSFQYWRGKKKRERYELRLALPPDRSGASRVGLRTVEGSWVVLSSLSVAKRPDPWMGYGLIIASVLFIAAILLYGRIASEADEERPDEQMRGAGRLGLYLIGCALLIDRWSVGALYDGGSLDLSLLDRWRAGGALLGFALMAGGGYGRGVRRLVGRWVKFIEPAFSVFALTFLCYLSVEHVAYLLFNYGIDKEIRVAALVAADHYPDHVQKAIPNLWSNFVPNPKAGVVNQRGWRWGGGEKKAQTRILCLGGSTTWGQVIADGENSYPAVLERVLRDRGYAVDTVNAGMYYYSSMEELTTLAFRGVAEKPDIVLIHSGINDIEPIVSNGDYKADYSHWRTVNPALERDNPNLTFRDLYKIPSWTVRLMGALTLHPDGSHRAAVGVQTFALGEAIRSAGDDGPYVEGFARNLGSMIGIIRQAGAEPVLLDFAIQFDHSRNESSFFVGLNPAERHHALARWERGSRGANDTILSIAKKTGVPLIPYSRFEPSSKKMWYDFCHLTRTGVAEKAIFIADELIATGLLKK